MLTNRRIKNRPFKLQPEVLMEVEASSVMSRYYYAIVEAKTRRARKRFSGSLGYQATLMTYVDPDVRIRLKIGHNLPETGVFRAMHSLWL